MTFKAGNLFLNLNLKIKILFFIVVATTLPPLVLMWALLAALARGTVDVESRALEQVSVLIRQEFLNSAESKAAVYDLTFKNAILGLDSIKEAALDPESGGEVLEDFANRNSIVDSTYILLPTSSSTAAELLFGSEAKKNYSGQWLGPYKSNESSSEVISYVLPILENDDLVAALGFDILVSSLFSEIVKLNPAESSYAMIVRNDGSVVASSELFMQDFSLESTADKNILNSPYADEYGLRRVIGGRESTNGSFDMTNGSGRISKIAVYAYIPSFNAKIIAVSPLDELLQVEKEKVVAVGTAFKEISFYGTFVLLGFALVIAVTMHVFFNNLVIRPLQNLMNGVVRLEKSNFESETKIEAASQDEIGLLSKQFNTMARKLRESYTGLELKIQERTAQIRGQLSEIERLNKFMIGRELRMRELKKEIARLKEKSGPEAKDEA